MARKSRSKSKGGNPREILKEALREQVAHWVGTKMSAIDVVTKWVDSMDDKLLMALVGIAPGFAAATGELGESALKYVQSETGMLKGIDGDVMGEVIEAILKAFFLALPNAATPQQARMAMTKASTETAATFAAKESPEAARAVAKGTYVINDVMLDRLVAFCEKQGRSLSRDLMHYGLGIAALTRAALDPNAGIALAADARHAFDAGDFSDVAKFVTFVQVVERYLPQLEAAAKAVEGASSGVSKELELDAAYRMFEAFVEGLIGVVMANSQTSGWRQRAEAYGTRFLVNSVREFEQVGGQGLLRMFRNWGAPSLIAYAQTLFGVLFIWIAVYVSTALPWFYLSVHGKLPAVLLIAVLNMLNNILLLPIFFNLAGAPGDLVSQSVDRIFGPPAGGRNREEGFRLHGIKQFRWQAVAPIIIGTFMRIFFELVFGRVIWTFNYNLLLMSTGLAVAVALVLHDRARSGFGKTLLLGSAQGIPVLAAVGLIANIFVKYQTGQMPPEGEIVFAKVGSWINTAEAAGPALTVSYIALALLGVSIAMAVRQGKNASSVATQVMLLVFLGFFIQGAGSCNANISKLFAGPSRIERQEIRHQQRMEELRARAGLARASQAPPIQIFGSSREEARHHAMVATGGPTRREDRQRYGTAPAPQPVFTMSTSSTNRRRRGRSQVQNLGSGGLRPTTRFTLMCGDAPFTASNYSQRSRKQRYEVPRGNRVAVVVKLRGSGEYRYVPTGNGELSCAQRAWLDGPTSRSSDYGVIDDLYVINLDGSGVPIGGRRITGSGRRQATLHACQGVRCGPGYDANASRLAARL